MKRMLIVLAMVAATLLAVPSVADGAPKIDYFVDEASLPFDALEGYEDTERSWGVHNGAGYRIEVPADWNGELVMWAHGFRGEGERLFFNPEEVPMREWLLANGYAWAASTYSKNGYNVSQGVKDTHALAAFFNGAVARPSQVYIAGASMGGHITAASVEQYRNFYAGALPVCGVLADYELFDYFLDFNVAAQQLALGTSSFPVDEAEWFETTIPEMKAGLELAPGAWPFALNTQGEALKQLTELRSGGDRPNFDEAFAFWNASDFLFGLGTGDGTIAGRPGVGIDNTGIVYDTDLIPGISNDIEADLNDNVVRVEADAQARHKRGLANVPVVEGNLSVPVLTLHNLGDLFVPFHMETIYGDRVAANGKSDLLVQRAIRGVGHCGFSTAEYEQAMADLVNWVDNGVRPAGDDVTNPAAVAQADFGCAFTDPTPGAHLFATPCP